MNVNVMTAKRTTQFPSLSAFQQHARTTQTCVICNVKNKHHRKCVFYSFTNIPFYVEKYVQKSYIDIKMKNITVFKSTGTNSSLNKHPGCLFIVLMVLKCAVTMPFSAPVQKHPTQIVLIPTCTHT